MRIVVNGEGWDVPADYTVSDVLRKLGAPERGVAVAVDDAVVPRLRWVTTRLHDGAGVEVLTAVQGG